MTDDSTPGTRPGRSNDAQTVAIVLAVAALAAFGLNLGRGARGQETWLVPLGLALIGGVVAVALRVAGGLSTLAEARLAAARTQAEAVRAVAEALGRLGEGLERTRLAAPPNAIPDVPEPPAEVKIREALDRGRWGEAHRLASGLVAKRPEDSTARALLEEVEARRGEIASRLRGRLDASRQASDPEGVLEARELLAPLIDPAERPAMDRDLLKWLMGLLMRRMRTGTVAADVAALAGTIAESFADTPEGASLRASLPTLRRSAGLCPRCSQPYVGIEDACPECHSPAPGAPPSPTIFPFVGPDGADSEEPEEAGSRREEPLFHEPE